jgi:hypothetical protein
MNASSFSYRRSKLTHREEFRLFASVNYQSSTLNNSSRDIFSSCRFFLACKYLSLLHPGKGRTSFRYPKLPISKCSRHLSHPSHVLQEKKDDALLSNIMWRCTYMLSGTQTDNFIPSTAALNICNAAWKCFSIAQLRYRNMAQRPYACIMPEDTAMAPM